MLRYGVLSKGFDQVLAVRPTDRRMHIAIALTAWLLAVAATTLAQIDQDVRLCMVAGLALALYGDLRDWFSKPSRAVWRPRTGWILEWADGRRQVARLKPSSRMFGRWLMLHWQVAGTGTVRMLVSPAGGPEQSMRRVRVLMRLGRANG